MFEGSGSPSVFNGSRFNGYFSIVIRMSLSDPLANGIYKPACDTYYDTGYYDIYIIIK